MLSAEENAMLTQTDPGTPMGEFFRRFWMPAMLSDELLGVDCPSVRLRLLGENLVGLRDTDGNVGVLDAYCPHRGAPLFFRAMSIAACAASTMAGSSISTAPASIFPMCPKATPTNTRWYRHYPPVG